MSIIENARRGQLAVVELQHSATAVNGPTTRWSTFRLVKVARTRDGVAESVKVPSGETWSRDRLGKTVYLLGSPGYPFDSAAAWAALGGAEWESPDSARAALAPFRK